MTQLPPGPSSEVEAGAGGLTLSFFTVGLSCWYNRNLTQILQAGQRD